MNDIVVHYEILDLFVCKKDYLKKENSYSKLFFKGVFTDQFINHQVEIFQRIVRKKSQDYQNQSEKEKKQYICGKYSKKTKKEEKRKQKTKACWLQNKLIKNVKKIIMIF